MKGFKFFVAIMIYAMVFMAGSAFAGTVQVPDAGGIISGIAILGGLIGVGLITDKAVIGEFYAVLEQNIGVSWVDKISMYFGSDQASEKYPWLGQVPGFREWIAGRHAKGLTSQEIEIINKSFEATIEIPLDDLNRDKTGQVMVRIRELADRTAAHWASLLSALILTGETGLCYDGDYFFGSAHAEGDSGTLDNLISVDISDIGTGVHGTVTAPSPGEMSYAIFKGISTIMNFKDDRGEPFNENAREFLVMGPMALEPSIRAAIALPSLASGETNLIAQSKDYKIEGLGNPRLTWTDKFMVCRTDGRTKPFIRQEEYKPQLKVQGDGSQIEFDKKVHQYGVDTSRNVGFGMWQHAVLIDMD